jgi:glycosyltransferase involved in cell wall biosynthesis
MIELCISTQTPPLNPGPAGPPGRGETWVLGRHYTPQLGGVVPMMRSLLRYSRGRWIGRTPLWVALGGKGLPRNIRTSEGYSVETVSLSPEERKGYGRFKERLWRSFHGPRGLTPEPRDYPDFVTYSYRAALALLRHLTRYDLFFINDFQQLLLGGLVGAAAPTLLQWHIPLDFRGYPEVVRRFFIKAMEGFDTILVSTRSGLEDLIGAGFQGRAFQMYPYLDPSEYPEPSAVAIARFRDRHQLGEGPVILSLSRMDPVKRQDLLLLAMPSILRRFPKAQLLLVGGSSFSTQSAGLEAAKDLEWRAQLEETAHRIGIADRVVFTGTLPQSEISAAYGAADLFVHPAPWEGFGLVAIEAWLYRLPVVVSRGAGVGELVEDGLNGFLVPPGRAQAIANRVIRMLKHPSVMERMGEAGALSARRCHVRQALPRLRGIFERTIELYREAGISRAGGAPWT